MSVNPKKNTKTVLVAFSAPSDSLAICNMLLPNTCRVLCADSLLSSITVLERYAVDMLIVEAEMPGISMPHFLPFLRERYGEVKVIVAMRDYSAQAELSLRPHKVLYILTWPLNPELLQLIVERGLSNGGERAMSA